VLPVVYPGIHSSMPYASPHALVHSIATILLAFVSSLAKTHSEYHLIKDINDQDKIFSQEEFATFRCTVSTLKCILDDATSGIAALGLPPQLMKVFDQHFDYVRTWIPQDVDECLEDWNARIVFFITLNSRIYRFGQLHKKIMSIVLPTDRYLAFCMGTHPRLGEGSCHHEIAPETLMQIFEPVVMQHLLEALSLSD
jgi:hypothetical protein